MKPISVLNVSLDFGDATIPLGRLALGTGIGVFEFDAGFAASGLTANPFWGTSGLVRARAVPFNGLHGIFADSLPDAWGELLVRRRLEEEGVSYDALTVLDKLSIVGHRGMGALVYDPQTLKEDPSREPLDLDALALESLKILQGDRQGDIVKLERLGGSSGGTRPKVLAFMDAAGHICSAAAPGFEPWLIKFVHINDFPDIGPLESAYADMARAARIDIAATRLVPSASGPGFFATKRFDRDAGGGLKLHMASAAALHDIDWQTPGQIDYDMLLKIVGAATRQRADVDQMFRRMVFNVLANNRDDHPKQHAFLMDHRGTWRLSQAFDLSFAPGSYGQHYMAVNGKGKGITYRDIRAVGEVHGIKNIDDIIEAVEASVARFSEFAKQYKVSDRTHARVERELQARLREAAIAPNRSRARSTRGAGLER